jgi:hypothetical protein
VSSVPILSLHPAEPAPPNEHPPVFRHILIPLDGSALAEQIPEPALALGDLTQAAYTSAGDRTIRPAWAAASLLPPADGWLGHPDDLRCGAVDVPTTFARAAAR